MWSGQPVALVIAESEAAAEDGAARVWAEEEPLEAVLDLEAAMASGAAPSRVTAVAGGGDGGAGAHGAGGEADESGAPDSPNVASFARLHRGDVDAELARADAVVSGRFRTNWIHQAYLEPQSTLAWVDPDGTLVVHSSTQGAFMARQGIAELLGLLDGPRARAGRAAGRGVRRQADDLRAAGGGRGAASCGGRCGSSSGAREDFAAANPAPGQLIDLELGVTRDGEFTGIRGRIVGDRGGLGEMGVESISTALSTGPYRWAAHDLTSVGVTTNRVSAGAYRAPGAPPAAFAVETLIDRAAAELGLDPIELRLQNVLVAGDAGLDGAEIKSFGARECLEAVRAHPLWASRDSLPEGEGIGVAVGFWPGGLEPAAAICKLDGDGKLTVVTAASDMSGIENAFIAIAAETFGLAEDSVRVAFGDTSATPYGGVAGGSKITYTYGRAIERAAEAARERLLDVASSELEIAPEDLELVDGEVRPGGRAGPRGRRSPTWRPRRTPSAPRTPRSRATAASRRSAARRARRPTSRTSAWTARRAP